MNKIKHAALAGVIAITLTGCSVFDRMVYQIDIPQGNFIEQSQIDKVKLGMSQEQVAYLLGHPVLKDSFDTGNWYYLYQLKSGKTSQVTKKELTIRFNNDQVVSIDGSYND